MKRLMSVSGPKRTLRWRRGMSAFEGKGESGLPLPISHGNADATRDINTRAHARTTWRYSRVPLDMVSLTQLLRTHPDGLLAALIRRTGLRGRCLPFMTRPI